jgi:hypothetical protein
MSASQLLGKRLKKRATGPSLEGNIVIRGYDHIVYLVAN